MLEKAGSDTLGTLFIADSDTSLPEMQGLGLFSSRRLRLRFSENIELNDSTRISVQDTVGNSLSGAFPLYISPAEGYVLFAQSESDLDPEESYRLVVRNISDQAGNIQPLTTQNFTGSAQEDTTAQRVVEVAAANGIFPGDPVEVTYAAPIGSASVRDSIKVVQGDSLRTSWPNLEIQQNKVRVLPEGRWQSGVDYEVRFWNPATSGYRSVTPTVWFESDLGALNVVFADTSAAAASRATRLILKDEKRNTVADTIFTGSVEIANLAPEPHQLMLYQDLNGNGEWDSGSVLPYEAPEPYYIRNDIPVQRGFTSDLTVEFRNRSEE